MTAIYHYTSIENWKQIQRERVLLPKTIESFASTENRINERLRGLIGYFLVGLEKPKDERWKEAGLWYPLKEQTTLEVLLEVPILDAKKGFVREHWHYSPQGFKEKCGVNLWRWVDEWELEQVGCDRQRARKLRQESFSNYVHSAVPLAEYDGSFRVPEFWLQQETPFEKIRVVGG